MAAGAATAPPPPAQARPAKQDLSWKRYLNRSTGYCIAYPARWMRDEAYEGAGMSFQTGIKRYSMPIGEMDIAAIQVPDQPADVLAFHLEGVKKFVRAQDVRILDRRDITLAGQPALFTKDSYLDPLEKAHWVEELVLTRYNNLLYRMEMVCRADHIDRFEPVFSRFVKSFQFDCNAKR